MIYNFGFKFSILYYPNFIFHKFIHFTTLNETQARTDPKSKSESLDILTKHKILGNLVIM